MIARVVAFVWGVSTTSTSASSPLPRSSAPDAITLPWLLVLAARVAFSDVGLPAM